MWCPVSSFHCLQCLSHTSGNMSSNDQSGIDQSPASPPLPSSIPDRETPIERVINSRGIRIFLVVDYTANLRKNSKISTIWHHGGERRRLILSRYGYPVQRVFSAAKRTLTPERNAFGMQVFEADECLRWWWRNGVMTGTATGCLIPPRAQIEAQLITALLSDVALVGDDVE
jgi:hypothetical protein